MVLKCGKEVDRSYDEKNILLNDSDFESLHVGCWYMQAKAEKILADASEKMRDRMALATKKAAEMRAAAEAVRSEQAAKAAERAELIRKTGLVSPARSSFTSCFLV